MNDDFKTGISLAILFVVGFVIFDVLFSSIIFSVFFPEYNSTMKSITEQLIYWYFV